MKSLFNKFPIPIAGLALALAGLGNLIANYGEPFRLIAGCISALILTILTLKIITNWKWFQEEMKNPLAASVFCTYPMALMILSTYIKPIMGESSKLIWYGAIVLHIILITYFTVKFLMNFNIKQVFPSWFIVYVGIATAAMTCKPFGGETIGKLTFWFGLVSLVMLFIVITKRVFVTKEIPKPATPTLIIYAAPTSLCLAGYMNAFDEKNLTMLITLLIISQLIYLVALVKLVQLIQLPFFPSFSAFTFPVVISAMALKLSIGFLLKVGYGVESLTFLVKIEELLGLAIVVYVLTKYLVFLLGTEKKPG